MEKVVSPPPLREHATKETQISMHDEKPAQQPTRDDGPTRHGGLNTSLRRMRMFRTTASGRACGMAQRAALEWAN